MYSSTCWHGDTRTHSAPCKSTAKFSNVHVVHLHFKVVTAVTASGITCFLFVFLLRLHNRDITSLEKCPPVTCFQISVRLNSLLRNSRKSNCSDFFSPSRPWYLIICCKHRAQRAVFFSGSCFFYNHKRILYSVCLVHKPWCALTCLPSGVIRLRLLVEMFRLMDMPANCRLLFPRMLDRALDGGWRDTVDESKEDATHSKRDTTCAAKIEDREAEMLRTKKKKAPLLEWTSEGIIQYFTE